MKLISVNVSLPKTVDHQGRLVSTGIFKEPVTGRVMVRKLNVDGDGQSDLLVHGGVYKAVYVYDMENIRYWREVLERPDLGYGQFGENFTVEGMPDDEVCLGDVLRVGSALLEVTQPRIPCYKLEIKMGLPGFSRRFLASGRLGFYCRVLEEGEVGAGDSIEKVQAGPEKVTVWDFARLYYFETHQLETIQSLLRVPSLPPGWSRAFGKLLAASGERGKARKSPVRAWQGFRPFIVRRKVAESTTISSFYLAPEDGAPLPPHTPGQFLTLKLSIPGLSRPMIRTYSLSDSPHSTEYRISIKRESHPLDRGIVSGSTYLHDQVDSGNRLMVAAPRGDFFLDPDGQTPLVLLSGGIGMTPMISILNDIVDSGRKRRVWFVHGTRNGLHHAMSEHLRRIAAENDHISVHIRYSQPRPEDVQGRDYDGPGHVTVELLKQLLPDKDMDFYLCGPTHFMHSLIKGLWEWGVPDSSIRVELFGPETLTLEGTRPVGRPTGEVRTEERYEIVFSQSGITAQWNPECENLLNFAEEQGVFPDFSCRAGICQTCGYPLLKGEVEYDFEPLAPPYPGQVLLCRTRPKSDLVIDA